MTNIILVFSFIFVGFLLENDFVDAGGSKVVFIILYKEMLLVILIFVRSFGNSLCCCYTYNRSSF